MLSSAALLGVAHEADINPLKFTLPLIQMASALGLLVLQGDYSYNLYIWFISILSHVRSIKSVEVPALFLRFSFGFLIFDIFRESSEVV